MNAYGISLLETCYKTRGKQLKVWRQNFSGNYGKELSLGCAITPVHWLNLMKALFWFLTWQSS